MKTSKEEFVEKLSELLQMANIEVESARLVNGETIIVKFECGAEKEINVRFDSHYAMIQDLVNQLDIYCRYEMGKKRFIEKLKDDDYGEQIREYSIKGIGKCYKEYFKNKAKLKTPTIETLAESVKELQQRIYVAEKKIAEMENHLFPEPADFRLDAVKDSIKGYIEDRKEIPAPVIQEYNRLVLPDYIEFFEYREKPYVCASTKAYLGDLYASIGIIREHISKNEVISFELLSEYNLNRREINKWEKRRIDSI